MRHFTPKIYARIVCALCIKICKNHKFFLIYLRISKFITNFANQKKYTMPVTKQKLIRHYALDLCLRNQTRRYYIEDLLAECNEALEANSSVATDESQSTITIAECSSAKSAVVTAELQTIDWSNAVAPIRESR